MTIISAPTPGTPVIKSASVPAPSATDAPLTPGIQLGMPGYSIDLPQGVIYANKTPIKLIPAIISTLALKLIFFTGEKASNAGKALLARRKASKPLEVAPSLATNPRRRKRRRRSHR